MKLPWSSRSPFARKVVVVAHELGIADRIALERVNVTAKETNATLDVLERETDSLAPLTIGSIAVAVALARLDFRFAEDAWRECRPKLAAWHARFAERPSMRATKPEDVY